MSKKSFYKYRRGRLHPVTTLDWKRQRVLEIQKARCHAKIEFHTSNVILQTLVSILFLTGGAYAAHKKSIVVPMIAAPSAARSLSKLIPHEEKRRRYKEILKGLERN